MDSSTLLEKARRLPSPPPTAAAEYRDLLEILVADLNERVLADPAIDDLIGGAPNRPVMTNNNHNHALFIASLLADYRAETFVETVAWVLRAYPARGFRVSFFPYVLDVWMQVISARLSPASAEAVIPLYRFMRDHLEDFARVEPAGGHP